MTRKTIGWILSALLLAFFAATGTIRAQVTGGTFTGEVRDASGKVVPDVKITIKNTATGVETTMTTTGEGVYSASGLIAGSYLITAEKDNFNREVLGPVALDVAQTVRADLALTVGSVTQTVEVKASAEQLLQTETGEISQVIGSAEITQIPLNGRNVIGLVLLSAGVTPGAPGESGAGSASFEANGQRDKNNLFLIDGNDNSLWGDGPIAYFHAARCGAGVLGGDEYHTPPSMVTQQAPWSISRSRAGRTTGTVRLLTSFAIAPSTTPISSRSFLISPRTLSSKNQFGGSGRRPIQRNKTFLFADYEGTRAITSNPSVTTVPTAAERTGNFTAPGLLPIYDPTSNLGPFGPGVLRSQFSYMGVLQT